MEAGGSADEEGKEKKGSQGLNVGQEVFYATGFCAI